MTITLPDDMRDDAAETRLLALVAEGVASGPAIPVTEEFWFDLKRRLDERLAGRDASEVRDIDP